ncbi:MAG: hypothetical protein ABJG88_06515 [Litorimonas sp.]
MQSTISRRARFVSALSSLSAIYGAILTYRLLGFQADAVSDILKFSALVFVITLIAAYMWWTVLSLKLRSVALGAIAGGMSAVTVIPLPTFIGGFKSSYDASADIITTASLAAQYSLSTLSLAEFIAIPLSIVVGIWASKA